jgi:hypothetical protein
VTKARLDVFDALGRRVAVVADGDYAAGSHSVAWQPRAHGPGVFLARLRTEHETRSRPFTLVR